MRRDFAAEVDGKHLRAQANAEERLVLLERVPKSIRPRGG